MLHSRMWASVALATLTLCFALLNACVGASPLKTDEQVVLFPVDATRAANGSWSVPLHGWVFEYEADSFWRHSALALLTRGLDIPEDEDARERFRQRAWMFLVDNERNKEIHVRLEGRDYRMNESGPNGHFRTTVSHADPQPGLRRAVVEAADGNGNYAGRVRLLPSRGVSVISDIDDTIKHSQVYDKKLLLANTFLHPWQVVPDMAALYQRWQQAGAQFHYVSGSPWQLYPALDEFLTDSGFPQGSYALRQFRIKDKSLFDMLGAPERHKHEAIGDLLRRYPQRRFILVGDSTESDPEIYGEMARLFPEQIVHIFIRQVSPVPGKPERYAKAFAGLDEQLWTLFTIAEQIDITIPSLQKFVSERRKE